MCDCQDSSFYTCDGPCVLSSRCTLVSLGSAAFNFVGFVVEAASGAVY